MLRLLSLILLLAGAGVAALGGWLYMGNGLPAGLLGQKEIVLERKVLTPEPPKVSESTAEVEAAIALPPPPPPPPAEPVEMAPPAPIEPVDLEPVAKDVQKKAAAPKSRSLTMPVTEAVEAPAAGVEVAAAPRSVAQPDISEIVASEPVFTTTSAAVVAPPSIEEQLYSVPVAFETPASASFNQSFIVTLAINGQDGAETATGGLSGSKRTNIEEAVVQVTDQVKANLFGEAFKIEAVSPDIQKLSKFTESRWRWEVTPTKTGPQNLTFEIFAIHEDDASELVRTFDDTVTVEVSRIGQAMFLAQQYNPIVVIFAGIGSVLAGLFGVLRFFRGS